MDALSAVRPLFQACQNGERQKLDQLLGKGTVDVMNDTMSLLHCAVEQSHGDIVQFLVQRGATLDVMDINGATPLHYAIKVGHPQITKYLLDRGALLDARDNNSATPLHWACQMGKADCARLLLERGADKEAKAKFDTTPLHLAARSGHVNIVTLLLQFQVNTEARTSKSLTPLHIAAMNGLSNIVKVLCQGRANIMAPTSRRATPLHLACLHGDVATVNRLMQMGADPHAVDLDRNTPISNASKQGHTSLAILLERKSFPLFELLDEILLAYLLSWITNDADLRAISMTSKRIYVAVQPFWKRKCSLTGCSLLDGNIAWSAHYSLVTQIQKYYQLTASQLETALLREIQRIGMKNSQPLHIIPEQAVQALINHGVSPNTTHPKTGVSVVHLALQKRVYDIVHLLVERGANINSQKANGNTPLHDAAAAGEDRLTVWLMDIHAHPNIQNELGDTPAVCAAKKNQWKTIFILAKRGADLNIPNVAGENVLHIAAQFGSGGVNILHKLIDFRVALDQPGFAGNTALHVTAREGFYDMMQVLLERGANPNVVNSTGSTPLHMATFHNHLTCVKLLLHYGANPNINNTDGRSAYYYARLLHNTTMLQFFHQHYTVTVSKVGFALYDTTAER